MITIFLSAALAAAACAADPAREDAVRQEIDAQLDMAQEEGLVCEYRQVFGSLRRERVCYDADEAERNADEGRRDLDRYQRSTRPMPSGD
ncbi:MAG: hypothetical protein ACLFQ5_06270 [Oceanicaulis sp.]